jgi:hypothetical protein
LRREGGCARETRNKLYNVMIIGFTFIVVVIVQVLGGFDPINHYINAHIWHACSLAVKAYTFTADIVF